MTCTLDFNGVPIRYSNEGQGPALVFLHGYLLSSEIWKEFVRPFVPQYRVVCVDLPGHGGSGVVGDCSSMELMAESVETVLDHLNISQAVFFGHSMGGYAMLALLEKRPELFLGLSLFHSHTLNDSAAVQEKRDREIHLIEEGHRQLLLSQSIPNMFATDFIDQNQEALDLCKQIAREMDDAAVIAAIRGLRARPNRSKVLENSPVPCLSLIGAKDNFISLEEVALKTALPPGSERLIGYNTGHMGFFEEPELFRKGIHQFLNRIL